MGKKIFFFFLIFLYSEVYSQNTISSPYSRFGIGNLEFTDYRPNSGMGGLCIGYSDPGTINYVNPASYMAFDSGSFVFQTGIKSDFSQLHTTNARQNYDYFSLSYLLFGFPITKWWHASFGLVPYSDVGYNISESYIDPVSASGDINYSFQGDGGIREFYIGNAFRIGKHFSVGANVGFLFGTIDQIQYVSIPNSADSTPNLNTKYQESTTIHDFYFNYGIQYTANLTKNLSLTVGATYANTKNISATQSVMVSRFTGAPSSPEVYDTILNNTKNKGALKIPQSYGFGFMLHMKDKWKFGAEYESQQWSQFQSFGVKDSSLSNSWNIRIGGEFIPGNNSIAQYWQKIHYRFGFHFGNEYLIMNNTQILDKGFSIGAVFPMKRSKTTLSVGIDMGVSGTTNNSLIREEYAKVTLCINVYERWFQKRKYE